MVSGPGNAITRAASALSMPISSMTMAIIGLPPVAGMARANCCQAGLPAGGSEFAGGRFCGRGAGAKVAVAVGVAADGVAAGASFGGTLVAALAAWLAGAPVW